MVSPGVAHWWILLQCIEAMTADVKRALDELVDLGFVIFTTRFYGDPFYAPNRESKLGLRVSTVSFLV